MSLIRTKIYFSICSLSIFVQSLVTNGVERETGNCRTRTRASFTKILLPSNFTDITRASWMCEHKYPNYSAGNFSCSSLVLSLCNVQTEMFYIVITQYIHMHIPKAECKLFETQNNKRFCSLSTFPNFALHTTLPTTLREFLNQQLNCDQHIWQYPLTVIC